MKKAQQLSINFLVKFILAVTLFGLGSVLIWNIFFSSTDTLEIVDEEFDKRIFALNCKPLETVCVGGTVVEIESGENLLFTVKVFNNHNNANSYDLGLDLYDSNGDKVTNNAEAIFSPPFKEFDIPAKDSLEMDFLLKTSKHLEEGEYAIRLVVNPDAVGMADVPKRLYLTVN